jgi:hypothetical protein
MISKWTSHLDTPEKQKQFAQEIQGSRRVLDRLKTIVEEQEQELNKAEINIKNYEIPNWDYRQAHNNGYRQCLQILKILTNLDQEDNPNK